MKFSSVVLAALAATASAACVNSTNGGCDICGSSEPVSVSDWCSQYSGWSQECCECIANAESGGNAHACNHNSNDSYDVGLWQINSINWGSCNGGNAPCDPSSNLYCATQIFQGGKNTWKYWATCGGCGCCGRA